MLLRRPDEGSYNQLMIQINEINSKYVRAYNNNSFTNSQLEKSEHSLNLRFYYYVKTRFQGGSRNKHLGRKIYYRCL